MKQIKKHFGIKNKLVITMSYNKIKKNSALNNISSKASVNNSIFFKSKLTCWHFKMGQKGDIGIQ